MKVPNIFRPKHSIAGRLTLGVMGTIFLVFATVTALIAGFMWFMILALMANTYQGMLDVSNEKIDNALTAVEVAIANTIPEVEESLSTPDKMYAITERILQLNPNIVGSSVAFEPNYYPQKGKLFAPYAYRDGDTIKTKQLGCADYEYHDMDWYRTPKQQGQAGWSEPYYDKGGANIPMTTFSQPLFNSRGELYAVVTADVALDWITVMTHEMDSINNHNTVLSEAGHSYSFIIGRGGTYIAHPNKELVLNETIMSDCKKTATTQDDSIASQMMAGKKEYSLYKNGDTSGFIFYSPIEHTGWSMAIVVPGAELFLAPNALVGFILIAMGIGLVVIFLVCQLAIRKVTRPLTRFAHSADEIAQGNINAELPTIKTHDEMQKLRTSFKTMQKSLIRQIDETKTVNEAKGRMESELRIARNLQMAMLPKTFPPFPDRKDIDIYAQLTPAKEVGGDLYDFYIRDEKLFFCVGDVSGKGVPASLVMAVTRALFRTVSAHENNPAKIVTNINDIMAEENDSNMFVTLFLGVLDLPSGRLRYCNAGHCAPLLIGAGAGLLPIIPNLPLGILSDFKFEPQETMVYPGTSIFLYTDGLTEAENIHHELYGDDRLLKTAQSIYDGQDYRPQILLEQLTQSVADFVGDAEQSDDLTMMAIQYQKTQQDIRLRRGIALPNNVETIPQLNAFIDGVAEEIGLDMSLTMSLNLAIEEAVVNVMNYAYPQGKQGDVNIEAIADDERLTFVISDSGAAFDPTAKEEADTSLSVEERPVGGLGIYLVRQLMDTINYERVDGKNVLTLIKNYSPNK